MNISLYQRFIFARHVAGNRQRSAKKQRNTSHFLLLNTSNAYRSARPVTFPPIVKPIGDPNDAGEKIPEKGPGPFFAGKGSARR